MTEYSHQKYSGAPEIVTAAKHCSMDTRSSGRNEFVRQLFKFLIVGVLNTAIQYVVFVFLYSIAGINYLVASTAGYCLGMVNSYLLNRRWTFASGNVQILGEAIRFTAVNLAALGTNAGLLFLLVSIQNMQPQIAQLWAIAGSVIVNFVLNKFWTFKSARVRRNDHRNTHPDSDYQ